jgi:hypothetical protein
MAQKSYHTHAQILNDHAEEDLALEPPEDNERWAKRLIKALRRIFGK